MSERIHTFGASGSGTTSLAKALANARGLPHVDTDDVFWLPTSPPFTTPRERTARQELLQQVLGQQDQWVLSGSLCGWGDLAIPLFDLAVFLWVPREIRVDRLRLREMDRYGSQIANPSDPQNEAHTKFLEWAGAYDEGGLDMRSRARHEQWIKILPCPLIRIEGTQPIDESSRIVLDYLQAISDSIGSQ